MRRLRYICINFFVLLFLASCGGGSGSPEVSNPAPHETNESQATVAMANPQVKTPTPTPTPDPVDEYIKSTIAKMTIEEKVGQMFICAFRYGKEDYTALSPSMIEAINFYHLGGVALFSENLLNESQTKKLIDDLQGESQVPLLIAVDEEGGRVSRLSALGYERLSSASSVGATGDASQAFSRGKTIADYLKKTGFNMDFAPVADINSNPQNTVIGNRAFSPEPEVAGAMVSEFVKGMKSQGIIATLKHFPGHGDTKEDTHNDNAFVTHDIERLTEKELVPFKMGIESGADVVMVGHMSVPSVTGNDEPCVFSEAMIKGVLREQLGFKGVVITDALDMGAIVKNVEPDQATVKAILAGVDIVLMPHDLKIAYEGVMNALENGVISESRIDESVSRILQIKVQYGILYRLL